MSAVTTLPCAPWCTYGAGCTGMECHHRGGEVEALHQTLEDGGEIAHLAIALTRLMPSDYRTPALATTDTCVISVGVGRRDFAPALYAELTPREALMAAEQLTLFARLAGEDAAVLAGAGLLVSVQS